MKLPELKPGVRPLFVLGDPIAHSLSPGLFNPVFHKAQLPYCYLPLRVSPRDLKKVLQKLRKIRSPGFNLTVPLKETAIRHLDAVDEFAARIGAVNTVVVRNGRFIGFNTDAKAFSDALRFQRGVNFSGMSVLVFGAGGAARAVCFQCAKLGAHKIVVVSRNPSRARKIVRKYRKNFPALSLECLAWKKKSVDAVISEMDLVVNTTSIGVSSPMRSLPFDCRKLAAGIVLADLNYPLKKSPLFHTLKEQGASRRLEVTDGSEMLVRQAAKNFRLWTGQDEPVDAMRKQLKRMLRP